MEKKEETEEFEKAFERLEHLLEEMNTGKLSLDQSLKAFEEANGLINSCNKKLASAEQKIEALLKNRQNELILDKNKKPVQEPFDPKNKDLFASKS